MQKLLLLLATLLAATALFSQSITFEQWLSLRQASGATISPDGESIAYTITSTNWKDNTYDTEIWLSRKGASPFQLTRTPKGSSTNPKWSPDSKWIAFLSDRGNKSQLYLISAAGGEAYPLTNEEEGITNFAWSPTGKELAFTRNDTDSKSAKAVKDRFGAFSEEGKEYKLTHCWLLPFNPDSIAHPIRLTEGNYTVTGFRWSPDGNQIAIERQPDPLIPSSIHASILI